MKDIKQASTIYLCWGLFFYFRKKTKTNNSPSIPDKK